MSASAAQIAAVLRSLPEAELSERALEQALGHEVGVVFHAFSGTEMLLSRSFRIEPQALLHPGQWEPLEQAQRRLDSLLERASPEDGGAGAPGEAQRRPRERLSELAEEG